MLPLNGESILNYFIEPLYQFHCKIIMQFRNEGIEIRRFLYKSSNDPTIQQLKDDVKQLYPQLRGEKFELMYLGELMAL